jgi:nickel/cobalt exporter
VRRLLLLLAAIAALVGPAAASAHPLGNFSVNRYSRVELSGDRIYVLYVLDMAEIPAYQERQSMGDEGAYARATAARIGRGLELTVDGQRLRLTPLRHALAFPPGAAGLRTIRLQAVYASEPVERRERPLPLIYRDTNFADRIGWKEIVLRAESDAELVSATVPEESVSRETLAYPKERLQSPLDVTEARAEFVPGNQAAVPPGLLSRQDLEERVAVRVTADGRFAELITRDDLSFGVVLLALLVAAFWGAAHAFSPGHGKAIVAGYLVGSRGKPRHAVLLGLIVTFTHTIGVFALGLVTLALSEFIVPEQLYPWLNLVAALLVVCVGLAILRWRLREWREASPRDDASHGHAGDGYAGHGHADRHGHGHHSHLHGGHGHGAVGHSDPHAASGPGTSRRALLGIGISAGILPCPTALVVLLAAISLHRVGYGLILIVAFSVGLAAAITSIGLLAVTARQAFSRMSFEGRIVRALPAVSAVVVLGVGVAMTVRALGPLT